MSPDLGRVFGGSRSYCLPGSVGNGTLRGASSKTDRYLTSTSEISNSVSGNSAGNALGIPPDRLFQSVSYAGGSSPLLGTSRRMMRELKDLNAPCGTRTSVSVTDTPMMMARKRHCFRRGKLCRRQWIATGQGKPTRASITSCYSSGPAVVRLFVYGASYPRASTCAACSGPHPIRHLRSYPLPFQESMPSRYRMALHAKRGGPHWCMCTPRTV